MVWFDTLLPMNTTTPLFKRALANANTTQGNYNRLGAASTQNVRNPIPLREIIQRTLPKLPGEYIFFRGELALKAYGKTVCKDQMCCADTKDFLGEGFLERNAMTFRQLVTAIKSQGYLVNSENSLRVILATAIPGLATVNLPKVNMERGRAEKGYYIKDETVLTF